jgi:hypothetical protein
VADGNKTDIIEPSVDPSDISPSEILGGEYRQRYRHSDRDESLRGPAHETSSKFDAADFAVFAVCELIAIPLCHAGWDAVVSDHHVERGIVALIVGFPIGLAGASFHWWKDKTPNFRDWTTRQASRWWPAAVFLAFVYVAGPQMYLRATTSTVTTTKPETGFTQRQVDEKISNAVTNLNAQLSEANRQKDAARREAEAFRQQIQNAPAPVRELDTPRVFTKLTPEQIGAIYDGRTPLQGDVLFADEAGKWLETDGKVENVVPGGIFLRRNDSQQIVCSFDNTWRAKLSVLRLNDIIRVVGKLALSQSKNSIGLTSCEFSG